MRVSLKDAEGHLGELIERAAAGGDVVITGGRGATVRLVPLPKEAEPRDEPKATAPATKMIGHSLDRFVGTWSAEQEAELLKAVEVFERVDESLWV